MPATHIVAQYGPWAVVTGASDGIGRAFAEALAAAGCHLVLVARRQQVLEALGARLATRHGIQCRVLALDLAAPEAAEALARATEDLEVGLLVAAAGFGSSGPLVAQSLDSECGMVAVNCTAVLAQAHLFGRRFVAQHRGALVLLSSIVAFQGVGGSANYAATKAYVQSLAEGLRVELAPHGVRVLAVAPGPVASGFAERAGLVMGRTDTPAAVARGALAALARGGTVRPGVVSKLLGWSLATAPRALRVRLLSTIMQGMTATG